MPRKKADVANRPISIDEWVDSWSEDKKTEYTERKKVLDKEIASLNEEQRELERRKEEVLFKQRDLERLKEHVSGGTKMGTPMRFADTKKRLITLNLPEPLFEKLKVAKNCYYDGQSGYIRYLIERDLEKNYDKYISWNKRFGAGSD